MPTDNTQPKYGFIIKKKTIEYWLEDYMGVVLGRRKEIKPFNSGPKPYDGISNRQLNKIMLQAAIKDMPIALKKCLLARWIKPAPLGETLRKLELTPSAYYRRCKWVIDFIYYHINNLDLEKAKLLNTLSKEL